LILDPTQMATVSKVDQGSAAEKSGFQPGDVIQKLAGQPLLSIADVQWVLHHTSPEGAEVKADVLRSGRPMQVTLRLQPGWRRQDDISWRASTWGLRRVALGGMFLVRLPDEDRKKWDLPPESTALLVQHVGQFAPHNLAHQAGVRKGDVLLGFDSRSDLLNETELIAHALQHRKPGDKIPLTILRNGAKQTLTIAFPN
jgi:S1-C subfamily serine protease